MLRSLEINESNKRFIFRREIKIIKVLGTKLNKSIYR